MLALLSSKRGLAEKASTPSQGQSASNNGYQSKEYYSHDLYSYFDIENITHKFQAWLKRHTRFKDSSLF